MVNYWNIVCIFWNSQYFTNAQNVLTSNLLWNSLNGGSIGISLLISLFLTHDYKVKVEYVNYSKQGFLKYVFGKNEFNKKENTSQFGLTGNFLIGDVT